MTKKEEAFFPNILNHRVVNNGKQPFLFPKFTPSENFFNQNKFSVYFIHAKMNQNTTNPKYKTFDPNIFSTTKRILKWKTHLWFINPQQEETPLQFLETLKKIPPLMKKYEDMPRLWLHWRFLEDAYWVWVANSWREAH